MTPVSPGTVLAGRFRLEDLLEEAGGARFWRATDLTLMRDVAVHVVDESDPRAKPLLSAARTSATITGPHLLRVLDASVEDGVAYIVNEWGNGVSLDRMLLEAALPPRQAAWLVREVAEAVDDAHRQGVAHGRLVPQNVLVNENGAVKLIGFVVDGVLHGRPDTDVSEKSSDVRNLAALLYAALVGKWPGAAGTTIPHAPLDHGRVMRPRQVRAGVPRALDRICDVVLNDSDPQFPIRTAHEIKAALSDFLGDADASMPLGRHAAAETGGSMPAVDAEPDQGPDQGVDQEADPEATQAGIPVFVDDDTSTSAVEPLEVPPLFADEVTQAHPVVTSTKTPYVGMGGGQVPEAWGPDAHRGPIAPDPTDWEGDAPGTPWLRLAGLVAAVVALLLAVVFAFNLGRGGGAEPTDGGPTQSAPSGSKAIKPAAVSDFDPFGDPQEENPESVPNTTDGDPSTSWETSTYKDGPDITVYKPGVGLLVDLGSEQEVGSVHLDLVGSPSHLQLFAVTGEETPTTVDGLDPVAESADAGTSVDLAPDEPVTARYLVVWFTGLPQVSGGYRGGVAEIVVRS